MPGLRYELPFKETVTIISSEQYDSPDFSIPFLNVADTPFQCTATTRFAVRRPVWAVTTQSGEVPPLLNPPSNAFEIYSSAAGRKCFFAPPKNRTMVQGINGIRGAFSESAAFAIPVENSILHGMRRLHADRGGPQNGPRTFGSASIALHRPSGPERTPYPTLRFSPRQSPTNLFTHITQAGGLSLPVLPFLGATFRSVFGIAAHRTGPDGAVADTGRSR